MNPKVNVDDIRFMIKEVIGDLSLERRRYEKEYSLAEKGLIRQSILVKKSSILAKIQVLMDVLAKINELEDALKFISDGGNDEDSSDSK